MKRGIRGIKGIMGKMNNGKKKNEIKFIILFYN
jgi:hypothetical protein